MAVLKLLWEAGLEDVCASALSKAAGIPLETAFYKLVETFDAR